MNSADRLSKILDTCYNSKEKQAIKVFEDVFGVLGCQGVANKLLLCEKQINDLEKDKPHQQLIRFLRAFFSCQSLMRDLDNERKQLPHYIMTLDSMSVYMPKEDIDPKAITELADTLRNMYDAIESADIPEHYRDVLIDYLNEMMEGVSSIDIGGIDSFARHFETATGKVVIYHEAFEKSGFMDSVKNIYSQSTKILNDLQIWGGAIGYGLSNLLN